MSLRYSTDGMLRPHAFFDPLWFQIAKEMVYDKAPVFVGHVSMVPELGYARACDPERKFILTRDKEGKIRCFDGRCRHRLAMLMHPEATPKYSSPEKLGPVESLKVDPEHKCAGSITCPIHQWTYELDGTLRGAPKFDIEALPEGRRKLREVPICIWNGLIFTNVKEGEKLPWEDEVLEYPHHTQLDLTDFSFGGSSVTEYGCSALVFDDVYFDDRHVLIGHKTTFGAVMDLEKLFLHKAKAFNVQEVGFLMRPRVKLSPEYQAWHSWLMRLLDGKEPQFGALWTYFYPKFMIEVYPFTTVVSIMEPLAADKSANRCYFFYPKNIRDVIRTMLEREMGRDVTADEVEAAFAEFTFAQQAAYGRTAAEDEDFVMRIARGLQIAHQSGEDVTGLPHPIEEAGSLEYGKFFSDVEVEYQRRVAERKRAMHGEMRHVPVGHPANLKLESLR